LKEEDLLSKASCRTSSDKEPPIRITSGSTRGCWMYPKSHFRPYPMQSEIGKMAEKKEMYIEKKEEIERGKDCMGKTQQFWEATIVES